MSDDKELLELAAKAAGIKYNDTPKGDLYVQTGISRWTEWNPLTNDGDALRLAVKLCIGIDHNDPQDNHRYVVASRKGVEMCFSPVMEIVEFEDESERTDATRRAIVRAAADIGRKM